MAFITLYPVKPLQVDGSILEKAALALLELIRSDDEEVDDAN